MHGSHGVGCTPSLGAAVRLAAAGAATPRPPAAAPIPPTRDGLPRADARRNEVTARCGPVRGGGPAPATAAPGARPLDPALAALLANAAPLPVSAGSVFGQLTAQLSNLLASISARIGALAPDRPGDSGTSFPASTSDAPDGADPALQPRQPPPPPPTPLGPVLSLDPTHGTIVDPAAPDAGRTDAGGADPLPSSWVPVSTPGLMSGARRRLGAIVDRIDALLAEVGMTRLQLVLLMALGPVAVAFLIDVVAIIASGG